MRPCILSILLVTLAPAFASAQTEIGTRIGGADILTGGGGGSLTTVSVPGGGMFGGPTAYLLVNVAPNVRLGPEANFNLLSSGGTTITTIGLAGWIEYLFTPGANSGYLAANAAIQYASSGGNSNSETGAGGAVGYRAQVVSNVAVGVEAGYRRWFDLQINEILLSLKLAVVIP